MAGNHNVWVVCTCGYMYINMYLLIIFIKRTHCSRCLLCTGFYVAAAAAAKLLQSCPTLCNPIDGSPPGCPAPGILQARTLEWVAISFSNAWKWKVKVKSLSKCPTLRDPMDCSLPGSSIHGIFQAKYWSGVPLPSPRLPISKRSQNPHCTKYFPELLLLFSSETKMITALILPL